jgi:hypothetical protein
VRLTLLPGSAFSAADADGRYYTACVRTTPSLRLGGPCVTETFWHWLGGYISKDHHRPHAAEGEEG